MPNFGRLLPWAGEIDQETRGPLGRLVNLSLSEQSSHQRPTSTSPCKPSLVPTVNITITAAGRRPKPASTGGDAILYVGGFVLDRAPTGERNWSFCQPDHPLPPKDIDPLANPPGSRVRFLLAGGGA